jgi:hypothetical protein
MQNARNAAGSRLALWLVVVPAALALVSMLLGYLTSFGTLAWDTAWTAAALSALTGTMVGRRAVTGPCGPSRLDAGWLAS